MDNLSSSSVLEVNSKFVVSKVDPKAVKPYVDDERRTEYTRRLCKSLDKGKFSDRVPIVIDRAEDCDIEFAPHAFWFRKNGTGAELIAGLRDLINRHTKLHADEGIFWMIRLSKNDQFEPLMMNKLLSEYYSELLKGDRALDDVNFIEIKYMKEKVFG